MERKPWFTPEEFAKYSVASDLHKIPGKIASATPAALASSSSPATWQTPTPAAPQLAQAAMVSNALSQINQIQAQLYQSLGLSPQPQQQLPLNLQQPLPFQPQQPQQPQMQQLLQQQQQLQQMQQMQQIQQMQQM